MSKKNATSLPKLDVFIEPDETALDDHSLPVFRVAPNDAPSGRTFVDCQEGYKTRVLSNGDRKVEVVESETFEISWLSVAEDSSYRGGGAMAKHLLTRALQEGSKRGFDFVRADIFNPRCVSIFKELARTGIVENLEFYLNPEEIDLCSYHFLSKEKPLKAKKSAEILQSNIDEIGNLIIRNGSPLICAFMGISHSLELKA